MREAGEARVGEVCPSHLEATNATHATQTMNATSKARRCARASQVRCAVALTGRPATPSPGSARLPIGSREGMRSAGRARAVRRHSVTRRIPRRRWLGLPTSKPSSRLTSRRQRSSARAYRHRRGPRLSRRREGAPGRGARVDRYLRRRQGRTAPGPAVHGLGWVRRAERGLAHGRARAEVRRRVEGAHGPGRARDVSEQQRGGRGGRTYKAGMRPGSWQCPAGSGGLLCR